MINEHKGILDYFFIAFLLISFIVFLRITDFSFCDEHGYVFAYSYTQTDPSYGPLYTLWYQFFKCITNNNEEAMIFGLSCLSVAFPFAIYFLLTGLNVEKCIAMMFSTLLMFSTLNNVPPKSPALSATIFALSAGIFLRSKSNPFRLFILCLGILINSYIRPEFHYLFVIFFIYLLYDTVKLFHKDKFFAVGSIFILYIIFYFSFGSLFEDKTNRQLLAFSQHYAFNYVNVNKSDIDPFLEYNEIINAEFGPDITSLKDILLANPSKFLNHILLNIRNYFWVFSDLIIGIFIPDFLFGTDIAGHYNLLVWTLMLFVIYILFRRKIRIVNKYLISKREFFLLVITVILHFLLLSAILIIAPRYQYFPMQIPLFVIEITLLAKHYIVFEPLKISTRAKNTITIIFTIICLFRFALPQIINEPNTPIRNSIKKVNTILAAQQKDTLFSESSYIKYLTNKTVSEIEIEKSEIKISSHNIYLLKKKNTYLQKFDNQWQCVSLDLEDKFVLLVHKNK